MKSFFERYSYDSVRMGLNQFATAIFGFALALTAVQADSTPLMLVTSIGAVIFYLMLTYGVAWRVGSRDKTSVDLGRRRNRPFTGLWISLLANSVNLLLAALIAIGAFTGVQNLEGIPRFIVMLLEGMYLGLINYIHVGGVSVNEYWWVFFLLPIPSLIVSTVGYIAGVKDFHVTGMSIPDLPESDRPTRQEKREMRKAKKENQDKE